MTPQEYILSQLDKLKETEVEKVTFQSDMEISDYIFRALMSKKFRKYSVAEESKRNIRKEIEQRVKNKEPIVVYYPFGGYKLWRLEESPEPDWAELFAMTYYVKWLKSICTMYEPGVRFVFRFDEVVVRKLNNVSENETETYRRVFTELIGFVDVYTLPNMKFEVFLERSRYENYEEFEKELEVEIESLRQKRLKEPKILSKSDIAAIEMNVRLKPGQADNPKWREEIDLIHYAYYNLQENKQHHIRHYLDEGIVSFPFVFEAPNLIAVGTTKTSVAKFWVGVGALKKRGDSYIETVLSPQQLESSEFEWKSINIEGLKGKNFHRIRITKGD